MGEDLTKFHSCDNSGGGHCGSSQNGAARHEKVMVYTTIRLHNGSCVTQQHVLHNGMCYTKVLDAQMVRVTQWYVHTQGYIR